MYCMSSPLLSKSKYDICTSVVEKAQSATD